MNLDLSLTINSNVTNKFWPDEIQPDSVDQWGQAILGGGFGVKGRIWPEK